MLWADKVAKWRADDVTKAFFGELEGDISDLTKAMIETDDFHVLLRLQGMVRAYKAVMDIPEDGIEDPLAKKENDYEPDGRF